MKPKSVTAPNQVDVRVSHAQGSRAGKKLRGWADGFLAGLGLQGVELSIAVVGDRKIRALNKQWRDKNQATDVLSFPADALPEGTPGPRPLGDVIISLDTARRYARAHGRPLDEELARYLAHGILHLLGHDHERAADARKMSRLEDRLLGRPGMVSTGARGEA